jgi:biotin transport system substrate-specific component
MGGEKLRSKTSVIVLAGFLLVFDALSIGDAGYAEGRNQMSAIAAEGPLVGRFIPESAVAGAIAQAGFIVFGTLLLTLSAKYQVPFWPVPMTLQTGVVALIAAAYGWRLGLSTILLYLVEGAAGFPVFAAGGGLPYFAGPTGGFLIGFIPAAAIIGWFGERIGGNPIKLFLAMLCGDAVVFLLGFIWLAWFAAMSSGAVGIGAAAAFSGGVLKFVIGDLVKLALAAALVAAGARLVRR